FGDNDTLSAVVSTVCGADLLIILSDIEGLYDADPRSNPDAKLIRTVTEITSGMRAAAGGAGTAGGTGGMHTKLVAADIAMGAGIDMFIASGEDPAIISSILDGSAVGTFFGKL
ncbi:MAG: glutamate 5-kinase, partial [Clostridia bacterium]|nr:glutamate 5-kinase [Clostridia bacterium]